MEVKVLFFCAGLLCFLCKNVHCLRISHENGIWEKKFALIKGASSAFEDEFYGDLEMGPEKQPIEVPELDKNRLVEKSEKEFSQSVVDEETIRKAENAADKDLLSGLNRILKNNETLKDVFRTENV